ncbi:hypothetical protein BB559_007447 [Furculomyces boomerangus]|uniref:Major facilitator superfamily (MFS) profile domain-containing protein n=1 Tax=Furculomyces boomerangus TaxID=61424 RepID=A0A2T9XX86_9FUNG|nr:hypothetical protein BB559_007447 [Furculomyces boomerangus]
MFEKDKGSTILPNPDTNNNCITHTSNEVDLALENSKLDIQGESQLPPVDKGYAWVIMFACFINILFAFGSFNAFGVFQAYYLKITFLNVPAETIAWISTLSIFFTDAGGLFVGPIIRRLGIRYTSILGTVISTIGLVLASFSTKVWQLALTQGLIFGLGCSIIVNISYTAPALWFNKRRGFAIGTIASGGGFGSLIIVPTMTKISNSYGIGWAFRVLAILFFFVTLVGGILLKPKTEYKPVNKVLEFGLLKDPITIMICAIGFFVEIGFSVPLLYFPASLIDIGVKKDIATNMIMVFSAASAISRILLGYLAQRINSIYILIFSHLISGISLMAMWYTSKSFGVYLAFYIILGSFSIQFFSLGSEMIANYFENEKVSQVNGILYLVMGIAVLVGVPSIGAIFQKYGKRKDYSQIIAITSACYFVSIIFLIALRYYTKKRKSD